MKKRIETVMCYKTREPKIYNKGTEYEKTCDEFLAYTMPTRTLAEGQAEANRLNTERPSKLWNGKTIDWDNIICFFVTAQEEMY